MGIKDAFKNFTGRFSNTAPDYDDYDDYDEFEEEENYYQEETFTERNVRPSKIEGNSKVFSIHTTAQLNVVIFHPENSSDVFAIADCLREKNTVVLNLENTNKEIYRRVVDFLSGASYTLGGQIKRIANRTFIITPYDVGIVGAEVIDELENNGVFF